MVISSRVQYRRKSSKLVKITAGNHLAQPQSHLPEITGFIAPEDSQRRTLQIVPERELLSGILSVLIHRMNRIISLI